MCRVEGIKLILEPPTMINPIEVVYDEKGEKILGWRALGWTDAKRK